MSRAFFKVLGALLRGLPLAVMQPPIPSAAPLLSGVLVPLNQHYCSLHTLEHLDVLLVLRGPKLNTSLLQLFKTKGFGLLPSLVRKKIWEG